jgi:thiol-disulfide isomerase/thioredoxin
LRHWLIYATQILFVGVVLFLLFNGISKMSVTATGYKEKKEAQYLPLLDFENIDGSSFTNKNMSECMSSLIIYFNSECSNCIDEIELIDRFYDKFRNTQILFVSTQPKEDLISLKEKYPLFSRPNVMILIDSRNFFSSFFSASSYPTLFIYDNEKRLVERINHSIDIKSLLKITRYASRNT